MTNTWVWKLADLLGMTARIERRGRERLKADFRAVLTGSCGLLSVRAVDASRRGLGVRSSEAVEPGTLVFVRLTELGLAGFAHVRRCAEAAEGGFFLGLEFRGELSRERHESEAWNFQRLSHTCGVWDAAADV
jgi:hypothetical protein